MFFFNDQTFLKICIVLTISLKILNKNRYGIMVDGLTHGMVLKKSYLTEGKIKRKGVRSFLWTFSIPFQKSCSFHLILSI